MALTPYPGAVESAFVLTIPIQGEIRGLAHATRLTVQASQPVLLSCSVDGTRWATQSLEADELVALPFVEALKCDPDGGAVVLASFPQR